MSQTSETVRIDNGDTTRSEFSSTGIDLTPKEHFERYIRHHSIPRVKLDPDANNRVLIDKDKHPELYDWMVNG